MIPHFLSQELLGFDDTLVHALHAPVALHEARVSESFGRKSSSHLSVLFLSLTLQPLF